MVGKQTGRGSVGVLPWELEGLTTNTWSLLIRCPYTRSVDAYVTCTWHAHKHPYIYLFISPWYSVNELIPSPWSSCLHTHTQRNSQLCVLTKFGIGLGHIWSYTPGQQSKDGSCGGVKHQTWRLESLLKSINAWTSQASVTYIIGECQVRTWGANSVHPQHKWSVPWLVESTCHHLYLLRCWPGGGAAYWGMNDSHESFWTSL